MFSRGRKPSRIAWRVTQKAPEITAWEAMIAATVARITIGIRAQSGNIRKNGLAGGRRVLEDQRALAQVVQDQRREDEREPARRIEAAPKWPMSAYSASAPVTASTTPPSATNASWPWLNRNEAPWGGSSAPGSPGAEHLPEAGDREHGEPQDHHRPEEPADAPGAEALDEEQQP